MSTFPSLFIILYLYSITKTEILKNYYYIFTSSVYVSKYLHSHPPFLGATVPCKYLPTPAISNIPMALPSSGSAIPVGYFPKG